MAPHLRPLLVSKLFSTVASGVTWVLLPLSVYQLTGSALASAVASAANVVPYIAFGVIAGGTVDRGSPLRVMVVMESANALIMLLVPAAVLFHAASPVTLCLIGFASSTAFVWFDVASSAVVPALVGRPHIFQANGQLWMVSTLVSATAAPVGFFFLNQLGIGVAFAILAACYALSAVVISTVRLSAEPGPDDRASRRRELVEGIRFIAAHPVIRLYTLVGLGSGIGGGAIYGMIVVFGNRALQLRTDDYRIAVIVAASGTGALLGSLVAPRLRRFDAGALAVGHLCADVALMASYALTPNWVSAALAILLWNAVHTSLMVVSISIRQVATPAHLQGRVNAAGRIVGWGSVPLGTLLCGLLAGGTTIRVAILLMVAPVLCSAVLAVSTQARIKVEAASA